MATSKQILSAFAKNAAYIVKLEMRLDGIAGTIETLAKALLRHGAHDDSCRSQTDGPDTCDCGLDAAFRVAKKEEKAHGST